MVMVNSWAGFIDASCASRRFCSAAITLATAIEAAGSHRGLTLRGHGLRVERRAGHLVERHRHHFGIEAVRLRREQSDPADEQHGQ